MAVAFPAPQPVDPVEVHINHFFDCVVACAEHRRATLLNAAHEKRQEMAARVTERERSEQQLLSARADIERLLRENFLRETQERLLAEIEQKLEVLRAPVPDTYLVFRGECEQLEQLIGGVGEMYEEEVPVVPNYHYMRPTVAAAKKGRDPSELCCPHGVAIDPATNHIYVAEGDTGPNFARVSIFSELGEYIQSYTHEHMLSLWGIAIHRNDLYVTDYKVHAVFHLKIEVDLRLVARLGSRGSGVGQFNNPRQLCIHLNGDVYIADRDNNRIQILDSSLHPLREVTHPTMYRPCDVKLTTEELYVLNSNSPCVLVLTLTGQMLRSLVTLGDGMQVTTPLFFCLDACMNLVISDCDANNIKVFSKEGNHIHTITIAFRPFGLALISNIKLATLSHSDIDMLQIFSSP